MSWWNRLFAEPPQPKLSGEEIVKQAETIVRAYSHLVAESGSNLPETALPDSKEVIRKSLLLWAALDPSFRHVCFHICCGILPP